jgi:hypothetical protein
MHLLCRRLTKVPEMKLEWLGASKMLGAGEGNRTLVISLEGCCSTIELHPRCSTSSSCALC